MTDSIGYIDDLLDFTRVNSDTCNFISKGMDLFENISSLLLCICVIVSVGCSVNERERVADGRILEDPDELSEELAMPVEPTLSLDSFTSSMVCSGCHPRHYEQWRTSMHAYAMIDPVYRRLVKLRQDEFDSAQDRFCVQCHSPIGTRSGDIAPGFSFDELDPLSLEGVNCETCHRASEIARTHNSGLVIDDHGPLRGPIENPLDSPLHETEYSPIFEQSEFCASCHDVVEANGLVLERPFAEWLESPAAESGQNCQQCHMPTYRGQASVLSPRRSDIHDHHFTGVDLPLADNFATAEELDAMRERTHAMLAASATLSLAADPVFAGTPMVVSVHIRNNITGHDLPTGATFNRQLWLELTATDAEGSILLQTGDLDENGDLRDCFSELSPCSDRDLITLGSYLLDEHGTLQRLSWRAVEHRSNTLPPLGEREYSLMIPTAKNIRGPITIAARLRFRSLPPHLLRALGMADKVSRLAIHDIASVSRVVSVTNSKVY